MWNQFQTDEYQGMIAETIAIPGDEGESIHAYFSRPLGAGPFPGIVLIPHMPGWDEYCREAARRFTQHGYMVLLPQHLRALWPWNAGRGLVKGKRRGRRPR